MFPPHDEIRIKRRGEGFETVLVKDGAVHTTLFDMPPTMKGTVAALLRLMERSKP